MNTRIYTSLFALLIPFLAAALPVQKGTISLEGSFKHIKDPIEWIYFYYPDMGRKLPDSARVTNGTYQLKTIVDAPVRINMAARSGSGTLYGKRFSATILVEPGNIRVIHTDSFANITVSGSQANQEYRRLKAQEKSYGSIEGKQMTPEQIGQWMAKMEEKIYGTYVKRYPASPIALYALRMYGGGYSIDGNKIDPWFKKIPPALQASVQGKLLKRDIERGKVLSMKNNEQKAEYIRQNPGSPIALEVLEQYGGYKIDAEKSAPLFNLLPNSVKQSEQGIKYAALIKAAASIMIGQTAPDFTQNDTLGNPVSLSSLRGGYILLDFWASWCVPCRKDNPNLVAAYRLFHPKGFNVISVSLDRPGDTDKWIKAIHDDQLTWTHVSDLKFWNNEVAVAYGIKAVPQNFLLDPNGIIIARNLHGDALKKKLTEIYTR